MKNQNNFNPSSIFTRARLLAILMFSSFVTLATSQSECNLDQQITIDQDIDLCGGSGILGVSLTNGQAPYTVSVRDMFGEDSNGGVTNSDSFRIRLFPGTFELKTIDANGCEDVTVFEIYALNFMVEQLECDNGRKRVRFSNTASSRIPVTARIGGFGFSLDAGTSTTLNIPEGSFAIRVERAGCSPYDVNIGVEACATTGKSENNKSSKQSERKLEIIDDLASTKAKLYPNPFKDNFTLDLNGLEKNMTSADVLIYDIKGKLVHENTIKGSKKTTINLNSLGTGSYFVKVVGADGSKLVEKQLIKK